MDLGVCVCFRGAGVVRVVVVQLISGNETNELQTLKADFLTIA